MLAKRFRLQIQLLNKDGGGRFKTECGKYFTIKSKPNGLRFSRFGIVVSRKVAKSAVKRNKIKRIIFNFIRLNKLHLVPGRDVLMIVSPKAGQLTKEKIQDNIEGLLIETPKQSNLATGQGLKD